MYICDKCHKSSRPKEKLNRIITQTREVEYNFREGGKSKGWEIVTEIKVCVRCLGPNEVTS